MINRRLFVQRNYILEAPDNLARTAFNMRFSSKEPRDRWLAHQLATYDRHDHGGKTMSALVKSLLMDYFMRRVPSERTRWQRVEIKNQK